VPHVLRHQDEHHGQEQAEDRRVELGALELRQPEPRGVRHAGEVHLVPQHRRQVPDHHAHQNGQAPEDPAEQHGGENDGRERDERRHGRHLDVVPGGRRQVEADERHDGPGDHGRHQDVDPAGTRDVHDEAHHRQQRTGGDDAAERRRLVVAGRRRPDRGEEREGRAEVGREPPPGDDEEEERADGGEEQGGRRGEPGDERDQEGRAEHRDDVLGADSDRARPREPLARRHHVAGRKGPAVPVKCPGEW